MVDKYLFVIGSLRKGGAESQLAMLLKEFKSYGPASAELFLLECEGSLIAEVESLGVPIHCGGYSSSKPYFLRIALFLRAFFRLSILLFLSRYRVIQGYLPLTNFMVAVAGRLTFTRCVITCKRALSTHQDGSRMWRYVDRISDWLSNAVLANSAAVKADVVTRNPTVKSKVTVIHNGIDVDRLIQPASVRHQIRKDYGISENTVVFIIVANLIPYKGHADLLEALALVKSIVEEFNLWVVGEDRGIECDLKSLALRLGIEKNVKWLGLRNDVPQLLAASDIYVSASHEEGFSNSLLEAVASGVSVVATRVGGNDEMLEGGSLGFLSEARNAGDLGEKMLSSVSQVNQNGFKKSSKSYEYIKNLYAPSKLLKNHLDLYDNLLK